MTATTVYTITLRCIVEGRSYVEALGHALGQLEDFDGSVYVVKPGETVEATFRRATDL